jgi:hypothetical protein
VDLSALRCCVEEYSCLFRFFSVKPAIFVLLLGQFLGLQVQLVDDSRATGALDLGGSPELFLPAGSFCQGGEGHKLPPQGLRFSPDELGWKRQ